MDCKFEYLLNGTTKFGCENELKVDDIIDVQDNGGDFSNYYQVTGIKEVDGKKVAYAKLHAPKANKMYAYYKKV